MCTTFEEILTLSSTGEVITPDSTDSPNTANRWKQTHLRPESVGNISSADHKILPQKLMALSS